MRVDTTVIPDASRAPGAFWRSGGGTFLIRNSMVGVMLLAVVVFTIASPRFASPQNLQSILIAAAPFALIALGQTLVILTGGIDLSVGSVIALSAMSSAWFAVKDPENIWLGFLIGVAAGLAVGVVNGFLVSVLGIAPFVATLSTLTAASGLAYAVGKGAPILGIPPAYGDLANTRIAGLPVPVWLMFLGLIVIGLMLHKFAFGTRIYAVGGNSVAAEIAGIKVKRVRFEVYAICGLLAGISGVLLSSRVVNAAPSLGAGYELDAIAAVVIGGASLFGGRGTVWGTAVGLLLIQTLNNGLDIMLIPSYWQDVIKGVLIAAAVGIDVFVTRKLNR
ncbi:ABC transporter permease [Microbacterium sp. zg.B48]|uniref:ABC transporter permease n=1 Tax=Microbacterium sp. zg.B48 TaxID=2969408 RepID=UPI00214B817C|nr:ABC transporter permease [Microbacterium sp. zg.B48]MCR2762829.1 ABC transporter permease [Microbacterium sp. zg.B48]